MGINKIDGVHQTTGGLLGKQIFAVKVGKILLDGSTDEAAAYGGYDALGMIFWTRLQDKKAKTTENPAQDEKNIEGRFDGTAKPLFPFIKYYPLINEVVLIISSVSKNSIDHSVKDTETYYLPNINVWNHPHHNNFPAIQNYTDLDLKKNEDYQKAGLLRRITDATKEYDIPLGDYFREQLNIKPLLPYEGDMILEGRFGNSIRLGGTSKSDKIPKDAENNYSYGSGQNGEPITIIRNGQAEELDDKGWVPTVEDINRDPSSIYLTSNQVIEEFVPSSLHWRSYKAIIAPPPEKEVAALIASPVDFITEETPPVEEEIANEEDKDLDGLTNEEETKGPDNEEGTGDETDPEIEDTDKDGTPDGEDEVVDVVDEEFTDDEELEEANDIDEINDDYLDEFDSDEFTHYTNIDVSGTEYGDNQMDYQFDERSSDEVSNTTTESGNTNQNDNSVNTNSNVPEEDLSTYKAEGGGSGKVDPVKKLNPNSKTKKPNGYPCTIYSRSSSRGVYGGTGYQTLNKPVNATEIVKQINGKSKPGGSDLGALSGRDVRFMCLHTSAGKHNENFIDLAWMFLREREGGWSRSGYHIMVQSDGTAMFNIPFAQMSNGVGGNFTLKPGTRKGDVINNSNSINICWLGGNSWPKYKMTKPQGLTYKKIVLAINKRYPKLKIFGHNQVAQKDCPWIWTPTYCKEIGIKESSVWGGYDGTIYRPKTWYYRKGRKGSYQYKGGNEKGGSKKGMKDLGIHRSQIGKEESKKWKKQTVTVKLSSKLGKDYQNRALECAKVTGLAPGVEHPINNRKNTNT